MLNILCELLPLWAIRALSDRHLESFYDTQAHEYYYCPRPGIRVYAISGARKPIWLQMLKGWSLAVFITGMLVVVFALIKWALR
jgi:hypothetical protein